MKLDLYEHY